jgi:hypothetical protein
VLGGKVSLLRVVANLSSQGVSGTCCGSMHGYAMMAACVQLPTLLRGLSQGGFKSPPEPDCQWMDIRSADQQQNTEHNAMVNHSWNVAINRRIEQGHQSQ